MMRTAHGAIVGLMLLAGPASAQQDTEAELVWPQPPQVARIQYVGFVRSEADVGSKPGLLGRIKGMLVGEQRQSTIMYRPHDVFVDMAGRMFVADRGQGGRLLVFDPSQKEARTIRPEGEGRLSKPMGISGDANGLIYVADPVRRRVIALRADDGEFVRAYGGPELLLNPVDVAVTELGDRVYVADSYQHQIVIFEASGRVIGRIGRTVGDLATKTRGSTRAGSRHGSASYHDEPGDLVENRGSEPGEFRYPSFVAIAGDRTLYVSDAMNFRIQIFDRDGSYVTEFGGIGRGPGSFARPKGLGVDREGHVYVADAAFNNVQIFDHEGQLLLAFGAMGVGHGEFWQPAGMSVAGDRIYVVDRFNDRIQVFDYLPVNEGDHITSQSDASPDED